MSCLRGEEDDEAAANLWGGRCEKSLCREEGVAYSDDGNFLCEDHLMDWVQRLVMSGHGKDEDNEAD